jgi:asparagine synthase (glutamine-hydrolysing)
MCGIAGILSLDGAADTTEVIDKMTARLAHRGPDGKGSLCREALALGHRRLSIIDIESGAQPMANEDGQVAVVFNGEIYNYRELTDELRSYGHDFRTRSDCEVIVHGWEQWGSRCVERFRGMFAFAVADWRQGKLFLARDHLGIKPLYYTIAASRIAFASEIQALRAVQGVADQIDLQALDQYLELLYVPAPRTIFKGVFKLPPAHWMCISFDGKTSGPRRYWQLEFRQPASGPPDEWAERLETVLRESVKAHLVADVPFGAFLSGGMDSSAVVTWMSQLLDRPVKTFSIGFEENDFNELPYAQQVADKWQTEHHTEIVRPDALAILPKLVEHYGEPFGDSSAIPTYYVSRLARRFVPMVLSGDGGDEGLAGYKRYHRWMDWLKTRRNEQSLRQGGVSRLFSRLRPLIGAGPDRFREPDLDDWLSFSRAQSPKMRRKLWRPEFQQIVGRKPHPFEALFPDVSTFPAELVPQYMDYGTYLPCDILTKVDIASMMHGLEVRTPLVDVRVAEFMASVPTEVTFARDENGQWQSKILLRRILSRHFPETFIHRRKMGFSTPIRGWFAPGGALHEVLKERLVHGKARLHDYFDPAVISKLVSNHGREKNLSKQLWQLLFLEYWLEHAGQPRARN